MGSRSNVFPLFGDGHFVKTRRKNFNQMYGIMMQSINPFDFTIKVGIHVCIYYEIFPGMSEEESL